MNDSPYTEGWPKWWPEGPSPSGMAGRNVVPFSDAQRLREALRAIHEMVDDTLEDMPWGLVLTIESVCRAALNPERGS